LQIHVTPQVDYVRWSLSSTSTPATLTIYVDSAELLPDITYAVQLAIESIGVSVTNSPFNIPILIRVEKGMIVRPAGINVVQSPCKAAPAGRQVELRVLGTTGVTFSAVVAGGPAPAQVEAQAVGSSPESFTAIPWPVSDVPWISSAQSPTVTVPSTITLAIDPSGAALFNQAHVTVVGQLDGQTYTRASDITFVCTDYPVYLPTIQQSARPR
jgi:hypothetical protein